MQKVEATALPQIVRSHIEAINHNELEAFVSTMASNALVNDAKREFLGRTEIQSWARKEIFGDHISLEIKEAFEQSGNTIVRFHVDGDFDKSRLPHPLVLTYYFTIQDDLITQLIIINNSKNAT